MAKGEFSDSLMSSNVQFIHGVCVCKGVYGMEVSTETSCFWQMSQSIQDINLVERLSSPYLWNFKKRQHFLLSITSPNPDFFSYIHWHLGHSFCLISLTIIGGLPWWLSDSKFTCNVEDAGSIPGSGRSPGEGNDNPLQYSCLGNPIDKETWRDTVHRVAKSWMQ